MWVFGYGSLMWDSWETERGCTRRVVAELLGYCRRFNKASVRNWGTHAAPGPTLNLSKVAASICRGIAFEFPDTKKEEILSYLEAREFAAIEQRVEQSDTRLAVARDRVEHPDIASNATALQEALVELDAAQHENDALYARWAELTDKAG